MLSSPARAASRASLVSQKALMPSELQELGAEDRIAAMNMVKDGEASVDEAIAKVKGEVAFKRAAREGKVGNQFNRRGAVKKFRGRLHISLRLEKCGINQSLVVDLEDARDLLTAKNNGITSPFVKMFLSSGDIARKRKVKELKVQKTAVHENTRNPIFKEGYSWEITPKQDPTSTRVHVHILDSSGRLSKAKFLGGMSFRVSDIQRMGARTSGWYRLLDERKALTQHRKHVFKIKPVPPSLPTSPTRPSQSGETTHGARNRTPAASQSAPRPSSMNVALAKAADRISAVYPMVDDDVASVGTSAASSMDTVVPSMRVDDFSFLKVLGQGSFGKVLLSEHRHTKSVFAIKMIGKKEVFEDDDVESTMTERRVLELAGGCQFLTKVFATFQTPERLCYVMELVSGGDLMYHIQQVESFTNEQVQFFAAEIFIGLSFLHSNGVVYRDLKLDNVMLASSGHIKIADFGMCKENMRDDSTTTTFCGTPGYLAPEIIAERPYGKSVDFWSFGVMLYELLLGESPFDSEDDEELFNMILTHPIELPAHLPVATKALVMGFLVRDENKRLGCGANGFNNVKAHPFFDGLDWDRLQNGDVKPPFVPPGAGGDPRDALNFDEEFTEIDPELEVINPQIVRQFDQQQFDGFSFVNIETFADVTGTTGDDDVARSAAAPASLADTLAVEKLWFRPKSSRREVNEYLKSTPIGGFCVRESSSHKDSYALSVNVGQSKPWNGLISTVRRSNGRTVYRLFPGTKFESIAHAVDFYRSKAILRDADQNAIMLQLPR
mmetsp:Transcript_30723/g.92115  ORF Transcript_30723/g.92115 Transcript_30723/m.92115 type:complete len:781 (+) Transcript_30723:192-2534(+)